MKHRRPEQKIHRAIVAHLRTRAAPGVVWTTVEQGGYRSPVEAAILRGRGLRAGVSDILLWHRGRAFALEMKAPGGKPSAAQMQFAADMTTAGATATIAVGLDEALKFLETHGLLIGKVS
jgi:hypothetical protein